MALKGRRDGINWKECINFSIIITLGVVCLTLCATGEPFCYTLESLEESVGRTKTRSTYFKRVECDGSPQICKRFASKEEVNWIDLLNSHCLTQSDYSSPPEESNQGKDAQGYKCSSNTTCRVEEGVRQCYCNKCCVSDGETCILCRDCYEAYENGHFISGVYTILPGGWPGSPFDVYCDMTTAGGGWTVFHRRVDGVTDFNRDWTSYRNGFGSVQYGRDFWLGNEHLYYLTNSNQRRYKLWVDIVTFQGSPKYTEYTSFRIDNESTKYRLVDIGSYTGTAGDGMTHSSGRQFSTYDNDNDKCRHNCAEKHRGGWWYSSQFCNACFKPLCHGFQYSQCNTSCTHANVNGDYNGDKGENLIWSAARYCNLRSAEMKIRPIV